MRSSLSKLLPMLLFLGCNTESPSMRAEPTRPLPYLADATFPPTTTDCSATVSFSRDDSSGAEAGLVRTHSGHSFYSYRPASREAAQAPLLVVMNGGLTSSLMLAGGVGPRTVVLESEVLDDVTENPASWTRFAHLLFLDPPTAGYGYPVPPSEQPEDELWSFGTGGEEAIDAATVLLTFLECRDARPDRPVVLVGESAGGLRAAHILHQLRRAVSGEADSSLPPAVDVAWTALVRSHFDRIAAGRSERDLARTPAYVARQFYAWVLVQPALPNWLDQLDRQWSTRVHERLSRSRTREDLDWTALVRGRSAITDREEARALLGVDVASIEALSPARREGARRPAARGEPPSHFLQDELGPLPAGDEYYANGRAQGRPSDSNAVFAENLAFANTMLTDATRDSIIFSPSILEILEDEGLLHQVEIRGDVVRARLADRTPVELRMPAFDARHVIAFDRTEELASVIEGWLAGLE